MTPEAWLTAQNPPQGLSDRLGRRRGANDRQHRAEFDARFVAETPEKLRRLPAYYAALRGEGPFPAIHCNAPWVSAVLEANGSVRPCFFHDVIGNVRETPLETIVTGNLSAFRSSLRVGANPVCARCVCSLKTGWRNAPWLS